MSIEVSESQVVLRFQDEHNYRKLVSDFSIVLFRSDFVLVSEKNCMKVHTNQWL
jgi:hypothetical protein